MKRRQRIGALPQGYAVLESDGVEVHIPKTEEISLELGYLVVNDVLQNKELISEEN